MEKDYTPDLNTKFLTSLLEDVFGPCTIIGECYTVEELRESILGRGNKQVDCSRPMRFKEWFNVSLAVERISAERDGVPSTQIKRTQREIKFRMEDLINTHTL